MNFAYMRVLVVAASVAVATVALDKLSGSVAVASAAFTDQQNVPLIGTDTATFLLTLAPKLDADIAGSRMVVERSATVRAQITITRMSGDTLRMHLRADSLFEQVHPPPEARSATGALLTGITRGDTAVVLISTAGRMLSIPDTNWYSPRPYPPLVEHFVVLPSLPAGAVAGSNWSAEPLLHLPLTDMHMMFATLKDRSLLRASTTVQYQNVQNAGSPAWSFSSESSITNLVDTTPVFPFTVTSFKRSASAMFDMRGRLLSANATQTSSGWVPIRGGGKAVMNSSGTARLERLTPPR